MSKQDLYSESGITPVQGITAEGDFGKLINALDKINFINVFNKDNMGESNKVKDEKEVTEQSNCPKVKLSLKK